MRRSQARKDKEAAEMRERMKRRKEYAKGVPAYYVDNVTRAKRLESIRKTLGLTIYQMANRLGIGIDMYVSIAVRSKPTKTVQMAYLKLAEHELQLFYMRQWRARKKAEAEKAARTPPIPKELLEDKELQRKAVRMSCAGAGIDEIAKKLAVRRELVEYFIKDIE